MGRSLIIGMVAGEASGDNLAAPLIRELKARCPGSRFVGIGGPAMIAEGFESIVDIERLSVNAFPVTRVPELFSILRDTRRQLRRLSPDCFVGVDYNFFNGFLEGMMKRDGVHTVHYVSPTIWAWRSGRIKKIARDIDLMLTLYPFETQIYEQHGVRVKFVGHPKAYEIPMDQGAAEKGRARRSLGLEDSDRVIAILPGSRASEVALTGPDFFGAAQLLPGCKFVVPAANDKRGAQIEALWQSLVPDVQVLITRGNSLEAMTAADAVLVNSGTATLEALLLRRPMVMSYRLGRLSYALISRLVRTPYFALPNILVGRQLVPEFIQNDATPEALAAAMQGIMNQPQDELLSTFASVHQQLRCDAGALAATEIIDLCGADQGAPPGNDVPGNDVPR